VQGTLRAVWAARDLGTAQALSIAGHLVKLGNLPGADQERLVNARDRRWRSR